MVKKDIEKAFEFDVLSIEIERNEDENVQIVVSLSDNPELFYRTSPRCLEADDHGILQVIKAMGGIHKLAEEIYDFASDDFKRAVENALHDFYKNHIKITTYCSLVNETTKEEESIVIRYYEDISEPVKGIDIMDHVLQEASDSGEARTMLECEGAESIRSDIEFINVSVGSKMLDLDSQQLYQFDSLKEWVEAERNKVRCAEAERERD